MTKTADTSHLMEKEKTKLHPVLVTIKKKLNVCAYRLRLGKFLTSLLWEGEVEMPTLSSFAGLWAGNALGPLQSSSIRAPPLRNVWRPETTREHWTARACAFPASHLPAPAFPHQPLSVQALHSIRENYRASGVVFDRTSVNHADCGTAVRGFQPLSLQHCSKGTKNWSATAVFLHSLSLPINSRPTYFNLKTKRENLFNILSWGLSPKPSWMNLVHWSQRDCFHQLQ